MRRLVLLILFGVALALGALTGWPPAAIIMGTGGSAGTGDGAPPTTAWTSRRA